MNLTGIPLRSIPAGYPQRYTALPRMEGWASARGTEMGSGGPMCTTLMANRYERSCGP